jgi:uncharacterized protein (DUF58 family)
LRRPPYIVRIVRRLLGFKLTPLGRAATVLLFFSALGLVTIEIPIYQIFCGMVGLLGAVEFTGTILGPRLFVESELPSVATMGEPVTGVVRARNRGWFPAFDLMAGIFAGPKPVEQLDGDTVLRYLPRGETASLPVRLICRERGVYSLPGVHVHSTFPMNFMRFGGAAAATTTLTVVPQFHSLEDFDLPLSHRYQTGGVHHVSGLGHSPEYLGNRDYIPGEPVKRLDFKAWARIGRPVVREYQDEYYCRVALILDTFVPRKLRLRRKPDPSFEAAISLMASVAETINFDDYAVDLFAAGPEMYIFRTPGGPTRLDAVLEILAGVDVCRRNPFEQLSPALGQNLESISTVVCILLDWDGTRANFVQRIMEAGCAIKVLVVRERPTTTPLPGLEGYVQVMPSAIIRGEIRSL